jgi:O-antigen/teichoic acid export membrane protein
MEYTALDTPALWALAVGFFSPPFISIIQQARWSERAQSLVAFAFYLVVAAATAYFSGLFNPGDYVRLALLVFLTGAASYTALWKPTGVSPAIEAVTPPKGDHAA